MLVKDEDTIKDVSVIPAPVSSDHYCISFSSLLPRDDPNSRVSHFDFERDTVANVIGDDVDAF